MASVKKIDIAFPSGGIIPAGVLNLEEDKHCAPGESVRVPETYGNHLIRDRHAVRVAGGKGAAKSKSASKTGASNQPAGDDELKAAVTAAEATYKAAQDDLENAGTDEAKGALQEVLSKAEAELDAAKAKLAAGMA